MRPALRLNLFGPAIAASHEDAEGKSYEGNEGAEGMGKSYEKAEAEGNCYEMYATGEVSK